MVSNVNKIKITFIGEKKVGEKWKFFTSDSHFPPILINPTPTFPTVFKTWRRTFPDFFKTLPNSLTRLHLLPSKYNKERYFCGKYFHKFRHLKLRTSQKIFLSLSKSRNFEFIWIAKLSSVKLTSFQGTKINLPSVEI